MCLPLAPTISALFLFPYRRFIESPIFILLSFRAHHPRASLARRTFPKQVRYRVRSEQGAGRLKLTFSGCCCCSPGPVPLLSLIAYRNTFHINTPARRICITFQLPFLSFSLPLFLPPFPLSPFPAHQTRQHYGRSFATLLQSPGGASRAGCIRLIHAPTSRLNNQWGRDRNTWCGSAASGQ